MIKIGIIAEGRPDQAVIENIIHYYFKEKDYEVILLRPDLDFDATDKQLQSAAAAGGLARVKKDCEEGIMLERFFATDFEDKNQLIIQLDTAEIKEYDVVRPNKTETDYSSILRDNVIQKITIDWLKKEYPDQLIFAISIEELEAWLLTLYENKNSTSSINPKSKLKKVLSKKNLNSKEEYNNYAFLSKDFRKKKKIERALNFNESLALFCADLEEISSKS